MSVLAFLLFFPHQFPGWSIKPKQKCCKAVRPVKSAASCFDGRYTAGDLEWIDGEVLG